MSRPFAHALLIPFASLALCAGSATAWANIDSTAQVSRCFVNFAYDSVSFTKPALDACLASVSAGDVRYFEVFATATSKGETEYNRLLSERRAKALRAYVGAKFPGVRLSDPMGGGENPTRGARGTVVAVLTPEAAARVQGTASAAPEAPDAAAAVSTTLLEAPAPATAQAQPEGESVDVAALGTNAGMQSSASDDTRISPTRALPPLRLAFRGGIDAFRGRETWYPASGAEVSLFPWSQGALKAETGLLGTVLSRNDALDLYNAYAFGGVVWRTSGQSGFSPAFGARALAGMTWHSRDQRTGDGGGELRAGMESETLSVFAGAGMTREYLRLGIDAGVAF